MNIHVSNLSLNLIDSDLRKLFAAYGEVNSALINRDKHNGRSRGFATVDMQNDVDGLKAIEDLDRKAIDGKCINVSEIRYSSHDYKKQVTVR